MRNREIFLTADLLSLLSLGKPCTSVGIILFMHKKQVHGKQKEEVP